MKNRVSFNIQNGILSCTLKLGLAVLLMSMIASADSADGKLIYKNSKKTFEISLKYAYFITGPDAFDGQRKIRRLIFTGVDMASKIKSCDVMNCVDLGIEGIQVDLDAAPRILYWVNLNNQMVQYSGTSKLEALELTIDNKDQLAGKLNIDDAAAGGPVLKVTFDATLFKSFSKHR